MSFFSKLYNKIKRSVGKASEKIQSGIGKAIHTLTTHNNTATQGFTPAERKAIDFIQQSYKAPAERTREMYGFVYDSNLSTPSRAIYFNDSTHEIYYVIRGTKTDMDKVNDLDILSGSENENSRFNDDLNYYDKLREKYKEYEVVVLGSSLGGAIANYIGRERNAKGYAYNPGFGFGSSKETGRVYNFRNSRDIVSLLGANKNIKNIDMGDKGIIDSHSTWGL